MASRFTRQFESSVSDYALRGFARVPSCALHREMVELRDVWLDVYERRAVEHVYLGNDQPVPFHPQQPDSRKAQMIRTGWRARRKNAALLVVEIRTHEQLGGGGAMQEINQPETVKSRDVLKTIGKFCENFNNTFHFACTRALNRSAASRDERCVYDPYGCQSG